MKNLLHIGFSVLFLGMMVVSCEDDDYQTIQAIGKIKIDSVKIMKDTMDVYTIQSIKTYSTYPSQCEGFLRIMIIFITVILKDQLPLINIPRKVPVHRKLM